MTATHCSVRFRLKAKVLAFALWLVFSGAAALSAGCTHVPLDRTRGWFASQTDHITVYTDKPTTHLAAQETLESSYEMYNALLPRVSERRVEVLYVESLFGDPSKMYSTTEDPATAWALGGLPGPGDIGRDGMILSHSRDANIATQRLADLFVAEALPRAPLWLHVGLARYMNTARLDRNNDDRRACFGSAGFAFAASGASRNGNVLIPVQQILSADWRYYNDEGRSWMAYTAYAMVDFLVHGTVFHVKRFPILLQAIREGKTTEQALAIAYPHIPPGDWDRLLTLYTYAAPQAEYSARLGRRGADLCYKIQPQKSAHATPTLAPVSEGTIAAALRNVERTNVFHVRVGWVPTDVAAAMAGHLPAPISRQP